MQQGAQALLRRAHITIGCDIATLLAISLQVARTNSCWCPGAQLVGCNRLVDKLPAEPPMAVLQTSIEKRSPDGLQTRVCGHTEQFMLFRNAAWH